MVARIERSGLLSVLKALRRSRTPAGGEGASRKKAAPLPLDTPLERLAGRGAEFCEEAPARASDAPKARIQFTSRTRNGSRWRENLELFECRRRGHGNRTPIKIKSGIPVPSGTSRSGAVVCDKVRAGGRA
jgi:hypothetical protein